MSVGALMDPQSKGEESKQRARHLHPKWTHIWHRRAKVRFSKKPLDQGDTVVA